MSVKSRVEGRAIRHRRIRRVVRGAASRPRLVVFRSLKHIYAQVVDDDRGVTLATASSLSKELQGQLKSGGNIKTAKAVGELIGRKAREQGIASVVFDRAGYKYHGRVRALADAARAAGLAF
ncbi:MAG: 50S ribosomal protein L18 [Candidatus Rokubacteria bacterium]|nr:50S ribosomal protein L18 [Candidatus Rokubacteria bacterium]